MFEDSFPWVEESSHGVEGLYPGVEYLSPEVERKPVGACSILALILPVQVQGDPQRKLLLINSLDIPDSRGKEIAGGSGNLSRVWILIKGRTGNGYVI